MNDGVEESEAWYLVCQKLSCYKHMARHTGYANLPLHSGKAPAWLFGRMTRLAREIAVHITADRGP
jgi:hypothetical protein